MTTNEVTKFWPSFLSSSDYQKLTVYPDGMIQESIEMFGTIMANEVSRPLKEWRQEDVMQGIEILASPTNLEDPEDFAAFSVIYVCVRYFVLYLVKAKQVALTLEDALVLFLSMQSQWGLPNDPTEAFPMDEDRREINEDPSLPEWSEHWAWEIENYTQQWLASYLTSPEFRHRPKGVTKRLITTVFPLLVTAGYDRYRKTPKTWTKKVLRKILTVDLVGDEQLTDKDYPHVVPALSHLLGFVADKGWLNAKRVANYQRYLTDLEDDMLEAVKTYETPAEVSASTAQLLKRAQALSPEEFDEFLTLLDPDLNRAYLNHHIDIYQGRKWCEKTAIEVHHQGLAFAGMLLMDREQYDVPASWPVDEIVVAVTIALDTLYNHWLETPADWSVASWTAFSNGLRSEVGWQAYDGVAQLNAALVSAAVLDQQVSVSRANQIWPAINLTNDD